MNNYSIFKQIIQNTNWLFDSNHTKAEIVKKNKKNNCALTLPLNIKQFNSMELKSNIK